MTGLLNAFTTENPLAGDKGDNLLGISIWRGLGAPKGLTQSSRNLAIV